MTRPAWAAFVSPGKGAASGGHAGASWLAYPKDDPVDGR